MNQLKSISNMIEEANFSLWKEKRSILILEKRKRKWLQPLEAFSPLDRKKEVVNILVNKSPLESVATNSTSVSLGNKQFLLKEQMLQVPRI